MTHVGSYFLQAFDWCEQYYLDYYSYSGGFSYLKSSFLFFFSSSTIQALSTHCLPSFKWSYVLSILLWSSPHSNFHANLQVITLISYFPSLSLQVSSLIPPHNHSIAVCLSSTLLSLYLSQWLSTLNYRSLWHWLALARRFSPANIPNAL